MARHNSIFISYRRSDIPVEQVNLIHEGLENEFGKESVFLDTADIHGGDKWKKVLSDKGNNAKVCLVLIGPNWLVKDATGANRILNQDDWVRQEIEFAIEKKLVILPLLVNGGKLPKAAELPISLRTLNDSQGIPIVTAEWSMYKDRLIRDLKRHVPAKSSVKPYLIFSFVAVVLITAFLIFNRKSPEVKPGDIGIKNDSDIISAAPPCNPFKTKSELKTLIFPVHSSDPQSAEETSLLIDQAFDEKCKKYKIKLENQIAQVSSNNNMTKTNKLDIAKNCGADLYFSGLLIKEENQTKFIADFNFTNDSVYTYVASPTDFKISLSQFKVTDLIGNKDIDSWYEKVIQCIVGIFAYQKNDFINTIAALKDAVDHDLENDSLKKMAYTLIADSYYQLKDADSCLAFQQKLTLLLPVSQNILKTAILAEQYNQPAIAINSLTRLIDSSGYNKNILLEKRADQYRSVKDYPKAKEDYQKVKTIEPNQKKRVDRKSKEVETEIEHNKTAISQVEANHLNLTDDTRLELSNRLLQNGDALKAKQILEPINESSPLFNQAQALLLEAQIKISPSTSVVIPEAAIQKNPRLKVEAIKLNKAILKNNK
ncbi:MAG: toll/interleukin-1 receptor domain-containing protein [Saprospiraceae bacterium]